MKEAEQAFLELGEKYVSQWLSGNFNESMIAKFQSVRECLYECYLAFIKSKELMPIEALDEKSKNELWDECKNFCEPLSNEDRIKFVKAYRAFCCLAQKRAV